MTKGEVSRDLEGDVIPADTPYRDAAGRRVVPDGDPMGSAWSPYFRHSYSGGAEEIRLHYPDWEIAFEVGAPRGENHTRGRASVKPWVPVGLFADLADPVKVREILDRKMGVGAICNDRSYDGPAEGE